MKTQFLKSIFVVLFIFSACTSFFGILVPENDDLYNCLVITSVTRLFFGNTDTEIEIVMVEPGEIFQIVLNSNPSTGFAWIFTDEFDSRTVKFDSDFFYSKEEGLFGSPGHQVFTFSALSEGVTAITLEYRRPNEPLDLNNPLVSIEIRVKKQ